MTSTRALLVDLEPHAAVLLERHLAAAKEWFPHEYVPYHRGRDFEAGHDWTPADADLGGASLSDAVRSALYVNLLTEDNLPYYFRDVERTFGADGAFGTWARRWTAEEGRHAIVIRDYVMATRAIDPVALERGRMAQVSGGEAPAPDTPLKALVYVSLQEMATRIAHRNTGRLLGDEVGFRLMARVAADENLHHLFYRDLTTAAIHLWPSEMVIAVEDIVRTFAMPGTGIPNFARHSALIAGAGIYDTSIHYEQILVPVVLNHWKVTELTNLTATAERARDALINRIDRIGRIARSLASRRDTSVAVSG